MQDKKYSELADTGWQGMADILDKEMPEKKDRRLFFMLLLFLFVSIGATAVYLWKTEPTGQSTVAAVSEFAQSGSNESTSKDFSKSPESSNSINKKEPGDVLAAVSVLGSATDSETTVFPRFTDMNEEAEVTEKEITKNPDISLTNVTRKAELSNIAVEPEVLQIENSATTSVTDKMQSAEEPSPNDLKQKTENLIALPIFTVQSIIGNPGRNFEYPKAPPTKVRKPLTLDLYAGYALPVASQIAGPYTGIDLGKSVGSRWRINLGLGFMASGVRFFDSDARKDADVGVPNIVTNVNPAGEFNDIGVPVYAEGEADKLAGKYYDIIIEKIAQLYYLDLSLSGSYRLASRHEVNAGIAYSYLLDGRNENINLSEFERTLSQDNGGFQDQVLLQSNLFNRHNLSIAGSYRYSLSRNVGLRVKFSAGLNKVLRTAGASDRRNNLNYIGLGVDYRLKM